LISGAFGGFGAYLRSIFVKQRVSVEIFSFGIIAGLVGITAGCAEFDTSTSAFVGFVSAFVMYFFDQLLLRKFHVDDPLSVVGVHGFAGVWGTLAVGFFAVLPEGMSRLELIGIQALGVISAFVFAFSTGLVLFYLLLRSNALRVSRRNELIGLNLAEHNARLPWVDTIESIAKIMRSGNLKGKVYEEPYTEVGSVAKFFNHLLSLLREREIELTDSNIRLRSKATTDTLTKIHNRQSLVERVKGVNPYLNGFSLIIIDIDNFKSFNDTYGHAMGDTVLVELAQHIKRLIRANDFFARWGGEEFVILVKEHDIAQVQAKEDKIRESIELHNFRGVERIPCSFGVSAPTHATVDCDTLF